LSLQVAVVIHFKGYLLLFTANMNWKSLGKNHDKNNNLMETLYFFNSIFIVP